MPKAKAKSEQLIAAEKDWENTIAAFHEQGVVPVWFVHHRATHLREGYLFKVYLPLSNLPRIGESIRITSEGQWYEVKEVIHDLMPSRGPKEYKRKGELQVSPGFPGAHWAFVLVKPTVNTKPVLSRVEGNGHR